MVSWSYIYPMQPRPPRSLSAIWNMSFGFFGIQFGWGLQLANMSAVRRLAMRGGLSAAGPLPPLMRPNARPSST